jgi:uracil-DNA glycosylase
MFIGEAPGVQEEMLGKPFVGTSGRELEVMCKMAGIDIEEAFLTNVVNARPADNKIENFCGKKEDGIPGLPALQQGKYLAAHHAHELVRLYDEIEKCSPNVICPLGNTPLWALTRKAPKIGSARGRVDQIEIRGRLYKIVPAYHPAYILRNWKDRVVTIQDLKKVKRESEYPDIRLPSRKVLILPTFDECIGFFRTYVDPAPEVTLDSETFGKTITVMGIATAPDLGMVVPFLRMGAPDNSYWPIEHEVQVIKEFRRVMLDPNKVKVFQNGMYDMYYTYDNWKTGAVNVDDTLIIQHAMWPEMRKGLADLASWHTNEAAWKMMRAKNQDDIKREE